MENEEIAEGQSRIAAHATRHDTQNTSSRAEDAVKAVAAITIDEQSPLLAFKRRDSETNLLEPTRKDSDATSPPPPNAWYDPQFEDAPWYIKPSIWWLVVPFLIVALAFGGIIVTKLLLIEDLLCDQYFSTKASKDPTFTFLPVEIGQDNRQCKIPEVSSLTAEFMLVASLLAGIPSAVVAPLLGAYSDRRGRTRVLAITSMGSVIGELLTVAVASYPQTVSVYWILVGYFFEGITGSFIVSMAVANAYVSDCTPPPKRARAISLVYGCLFGGIAFGPLISAALVSKTGNLVAPFYLALCVHSLFIPFTAFVIPESVPDRRKLAAQEAWQEAKAEAGPGAQWRKVLSLPKTLSILWPKGSGSSSVLRRNLVLLAAIDTVCFGVAMGAMTVVLVYTQQAFQWEHSTTQYYTSLVNICRVVVLLVVLPLSNRLLRGRTGPDRKQGHTGADSIDLGFIRVGILFDMLGFIGFAATNQGSIFMLSGAVASFGGMVSPTLSSAMTRHMPAHLTGQLLGAIGLMHALARIVSPAIFNSIFALTAKSFPQTVFVCLAGAFGVAELLSWFVKPHVYYNEPSTTDEEEERPRSPTERELVREEEDVL